MFLKMAGVFRHCRACKCWVSGPRHVCTFTTTPRNIWVLSSASKSSLHSEHSHMFPHRQSDGSLVHQMSRVCLDGVLFAISETVFDLAHSCQLCLTVQHLLGWQNIWAGILSRFTEPSVVWRLHYQFNCLEIDLFSAPQSSLLPLFLTWFSRTEARGPDLSFDWNRWRCICLSLLLLLWE